MKKFFEVKAIKEKEYKEYVDRRKRIEEISKEMVPKEGELKEMIDLVRAEPQTKLSETLSLLDKKYPQSQIVLELLEAVGNNAGSIGGETNVEYQVLNLNFAGRWESFEKLSLDLETRMPNLFLESLKIDRRSKNAAIGIMKSYLGFSENYLAWRDSKSTGETTSNK